MCLGAMSAQCTQWAGWHKQQATQGDVIPCAAWRPKWHVAADSWDGKITCHAAWKTQGKGWHTRKCSVDWGFANSMIWAESDCCMKWNKQDCQTGGLPKAKPTASAVEHDTQHCSSCWSNKHGEAPVINNDVVESNEEVGPELLGMEKNVHGRHMKSHTCNITVDSHWILDWISPMGRLSWLARHPNCCHDHLKLMCCSLLWPPWLPQAYLWLSS